ncbi:MAG: hypothetical protein KAS93_04695 [Gammaproteobacteria bacterium]|nr:hypothetical protein [Gammaproteobacteria bacterium]
MHIVQYVADLVFSVALIVHGFLFIPQAIKIWRKKSAENIALLTFLGFNVVQLAACVHGYFSKDYILMLGTGFSLITCGAVTISVIYFGYLHKCEK